MTDALSFYTYTCRGFNSGVAILPHGPSCERITAATITTLPRSSIEDRRSPSIMNPVRAAKTDSNPSMSAASVGGVCLCPHIWSVYPRPSDTTAVYSMDWTNSGGSGNCSGSNNPLATQFSALATTICPAEKDTAS